VYGGGGRGGACGDYAAAAAALRLSEASFVFAPSRSGVFAVLMVLLLVSGRIRLVFVILDIYPGLPASWTVIRFPYIVVVFLHHGLLQHIRDCFRLR
jgi:hypothetical protein